MHVDAYAGHNIRIIAKLASQVRSSEELMIQAWNTCDSVDKTRATYWIA